MPASSLPDPQDFLEKLIAERHAMLDDLDRLVSAESPSSDPVALRTCRSVLEDIGTRLLGERPTVLPDADSPEGNGTPGGLLWRLGPAGRPPVLLVGHLDTVWPLGTLRHRPFDVRESRATGPGVFDMKAGLVQGLHALAGLHAATGAYPSVAFLVTTDEEVGSPLGGPVVTKLAGESRAALVLEGAADGGALKHARKGWSFYDISVTGRAAHAGLDPHQGRNALVDLAGLVVRLSQLASADGETTVTPTMAAAGTTQNTVPDRAHVTIDVRAPDSAAQRELDAALRRLVAGTAQLPYEISGGINRPPLEETQARELLGLARTAFGRLGLHWPGSARVGGVSDGNLCAAAGAPTLDGLGAVGGGAHADHEWADIARMPERAALVGQMTADLDSTPRPD